MAARFDRKFLLILGISGAIAAVVLGGALLVLQPWGPARHLRRAEAAAAAGDWEGAFAFYGRAFGKEPGNIGFLELTRESLLKIVPKTATEAQEKYQTLLALLDRRTRVGSPDPQRWQDFLDALAQRASCLDDVATWTALADQARIMKESFGSGDPARDLAEEYRLFATAQREASLRSDEREALVDDFEALMDRRGTSDRVVGALAQLRLAEAIQLAESRRPLEAAPLFAEVDELLADAAGRDVFGSETSIAALRLAQHRLSSGEGDANAVDAAVERLADVAPRCSAADRLRVARAILGSGRASAIEPAIAVLAAHVAEQPQDLFHAQLLAFVEKYRDVRKSRDLALALIDAPRQSVGLVSAFQDDLAVRAALQVFEIDLAAWASAPDDAGRQAAIAELEKGLAVVARLTAGADDTLRLACEAKIEFARGNAASASAKFEQVLRRGRLRDLDTLYFAALSARQVGESGRALQLLEEADALQPSNPVILAQRAEISAQLGRFEQAKVLGERLLALDPDNEIARQLVDAASQLENTTVGAADDPTSMRLREAETAFAADRLDEANRILLELRTEAPQDARVPRAQAQVALKAQRNDEALRFVEEALLLEPRDAVLLRLKAMLSTEDPIERIRLLTEQTYGDDPGLPAYLFAAFDAARREFQRQSEQLLESQPEEARRFADLAIRAAEAAQQMRPQLDQGESIPAVIAARFDEAMAAKRFDEALAIAAEAAATGDASLRPLLESRVQVVRGDLGAALQILDAAVSAGATSAVLQRERGLILESIGRPGDALDAYAEALARRPDDLEAIRRRTSLLVRSGRNAEALEMLRAARRLAPQDRLLEDSWLALEGQFGDRNLALDRRGDRYSIDPSDAANAVGFAQLLVETAPGRIHVVDRDGRIRFGVGQWEQLSPLDRQRELEQVKQSWNDIATRIFQDLVAKNPDDLVLTRTYAVALRRLGRAAEGEQLLASFIERRGDAAESEEWLTLGVYLVDSSKSAEALQAFEKAIAVQDDASREADLALSDFWFRRLDWERCLLHLDRVAERDSNRDLDLRRVECLTKLGRLDEAGRLLATVSERDLTTLLLEGLIADGRGQAAITAGDAGAAADAYRAFEAAIAEARLKAPASPLPSLQLATSLRARARLSGDASMLESARQAAEEAMRLDPSSWAATQLRADILVDAGDLNSAAAGLEQFVSTFPDLPEPRRSLVRVHMRSDNLDRAAAVIAEATQRNPSDAEWHQNAGELALRRRDFAAAAAAFTRAYGLSPNAATLHRLVDMQLRVRPPDYAAILAVLTAASEEVERSVYLQSAQAAALFNTDREVEGRERLLESYRFARQAIAEGRAQPGILDGWYANLRYVYPPAKAADAEAFVRGAAAAPLEATELRWLAELSAAAGAEGQPRAASLLDEAVARDDGKDPAVTSRLFLDVGNLRYLTGDCAGAVDAFEKSASLGPPNPQTLNNLAFLCADCLGDANRALPHIERAVSISPNVPEYLDTYGFVLWKAGRLPQAEEMLLRSLRLRPTALANYHLAEVLASRGNAAQARTAIQRARTLSPSDKIRTDLDALEARLN